LQCLGDDARGRHADFAGDLVDSNGETEIFGSIFFDCECVIQLQTTNEIIGADGILELDAEVVDNECEGNAVIDVAEKTRSTSLQVTVGGQPRDKAVFPACGNPYMLLVTSNKTDLLKRKGRRLCLARIWAERNFWGMRMYSERGSGVMR
jgi:hypothetical protein